MGTVYLICLAEPIGGEARNHARHYIGFTSGSVAKRVEQHRNGIGSAMLSYAASRGISFDVVRTWKGDRSLERRLKNAGHHAEKCPACQPAATAHANAMRRKRYREAKRADARKALVFELVSAWREMPVARAMVARGHGKPKEVAEGNKEEHWANQSALFDEIPF